MPKYRYNCSSCGVFEIRRKITDNPLRECPTCKNSVSSVISSQATSKAREELKTNIYRRALGAEADHDNSSIDYQYKCDDCHEMFIMNQSIVDEPHGECLLCGEKRVHRVISGGSEFLPSPRPAYAYKNIRKYKNVQSEGEEKRPVNKQTDGYYNAQY